jgi:hypothetical protein
MTSATSRCRGWTSRIKYIRIATQTIGVIAMRTFTTVIAMRANGISIREMCSLKVSICRVDSNARSCSTAIIGTN